MLAPVTEHGDSVFIASLFRIAKIWKQPKSSSVDEWIKEMRYTDSMQKEWNLAICDNLDGPREYYAKNEISQRKTHTWFYLYVESKNQNKWTNVTKQSQRYKDK